MRKLYLPDAAVKTYSCAARGRRVHLSARVCFFEKINFRFFLDKRFSVLYLCSWSSLKTNTAMDSQLTHSYLEIIQHVAERNADLEKENILLKDQIKSLEEKVNELENERRFYSKVYINEMHGTVEGDAYQKRTN